jgi:hypothetical protein
LLADHGVAWRRCIGTGREEQYVLLALMISFSTVKKSMPAITDICEARKFFQPVV